jgi:probable phosphoglycerate mutase
MTDPIPADNGSGPAESGKPCELVLVRHAESIWHAENRYAGTSDIPITPTGHRQAAALAEWAAAAGIGAVWCSDLARAVDTAAPAGKRLNLPLVRDARLGEVDFGHAEGLSSRQLAEAQPQRWHAFTRDPVRNHHPGGEDPVSAVDRFRGCLAEIAGIHPGQRVLVVTHSTILRLALCGYLGVPLERYRNLFPGVGSCARTEVRLDPAGGFALRRFNADVDTAAGLDRHAQPADAAFLEENQR